MDAYDGPRLDAVEAALVQVEPRGIDDELVRSRLMASMFGMSVPPPRFGRFELRERIGAGGMGVVYRAWDPQLERAVAIKLVDASGLDSTPTARRWPTWAWGRARCCSFVASSSSCSPRCGRSRSTRRWCWR